MNDGIIGSMRQLGVTESYKLKRQVVLSASEAAEMILRYVHSVRSALTSLTILVVLMTFCGQHRGAERLSSLLYPTHSMIEYQHVYSGSCTKCFNDIAPSFLDERPAPTDAYRETRHASGHEFYGTSCKKAIYVATITETSTPLNSDTHRCR